MIILRTVLSITPPNQFDSIAVTDSTVELNDGKQQQHENDTNAKSTERSPSLFFKTENQEKSTALAKDLILLNVTTTSQIDSMAWSHSSPYSIDVLVVGSKAKINAEK